MGYYGVLWGMDGDDKKAGRSVGVEFSSIIVNEKSAIVAESRSLLVARLALRLEFLNVGESTTSSLEDDIEDQINYLERCQQQQQQ